MKDDPNIRVSYYYIRFQTKHIPKWAREHLGRLGAKWTAEPGHPTFLEITTENYADKKNKEKENENEGIHPAGNPS